MLWIFWTIVALSLWIENVGSLLNLQKDPSINFLSKQGINEAKKRDDMLPFEGGEY